MKLFVALLVAVLLAAAGCSGGRSGTLGPAPTAANPTSPGTTPGPAGTPSGPAPSSTSGTAAPGPGTPAPGDTRPGAPPGTVTIELWFTHAGKIVPTRRTRPATAATSRLALTELVAGPSPVEASAGLVTGLPAGTTFDVVRIAGGVATVNAAPVFYSGGGDAVRLRQAQVVYTLTQFPTVSKVGFQSGGQPVGRGDYGDLLPAIVVTSPVIGQRVGSPVTVAGTADVFEATVTVRILDASGRELATAFTTATCGTGCRGDYSVGVGYRLGSEQNGTVEAYEVSAKDGSRINLVAVPVTLAASRG